MSWIPTPALPFVYVGALAVVIAVGAFLVALWDSWMEDRS